MTRAAIYCRISLDRDGTQVGVHRQEEDCRRLAEQRGWEVMDVLVDNSRSAWQRNRKRPGWDRLLEGIAEKRYDAVIVYHGDRLIRQPRDLEDLLDIAERGVHLASPSGQRDLSNSDDRFILRIEAAQACKSSDDTSRRVKRAHLQLAEQGRSAGGGTRPFGFDEDRRSLVPAEAALVREAARRVLAGETLRSVAADWNMRGIPTVTGATWSTTVLRRLLTAGRTAGWREHRGELVAEAEWPGIVERPTLDRLRALLLDPSRRLNHNPRRYLLTGLIFCGVCDAKLVARPRSDHRRCYVCASGPGFSGCGKIRRLAEPVENEVVSRVLNVLEESDLQPIADTDGQEAADAVQAEQAKLIEYADMYDDGQISRAEWERLASRVRARLAAAQATLGEHQRLQVVNTYVGRGAELRADWNRLDFAVKRAVVASTAERVTVLPAVRGRNSFDKNLVKVTYRL